MFVPLWLIFLVSGTLLAVITIIWAIGARQFEDQDRARFLPLAGLRPDDYRPRRRERRRGPGYYVTAFLVAAGASVIWVTLYYVARHV